MQRFLCKWWSGCLPWFTEPTLIPEPCWLLCHAHSHVRYWSLVYQCLFAIEVRIISRQEDSKTAKVHRKPGSSAGSKLAYNEMPLSVCQISFLHKILSSEQSTLSTEVFNALTFSSVESTLLINQCRLLEQPYPQKFTDEVLTNPDVVMRSLKEQIIKANCSLLLSEAKTHPSQSIVAEVASHMWWLKVWVQL